MTERPYDIHCLVETCWFVTGAETMQDAMPKANQHAWLNRGHQVRIWKDGRPVYRVAIASVEPWAPAQGKEELRLQIAATNDEAIRAAKYIRRHGCYPPALGEPAFVLLQSVYGIEHTQDHHCLVDESNGQCVVCDVWHGDPCDNCGGRGFHALPCTLLDEQEVRR